MILHQCLDSGSRVCWRVWQKILLGIFLESRHRSFLHTPIIAMNKRRLHKHWHHTAALISFKKRICLISYSSGSNQVAVCIARFSMLVQTVNCCWLEIVFFLNKGGSSSNGSNPFDAQYSSCSSCCLTESSAKAIRCSLINLASALEYFLPRAESYNVCV